VEHFENQIKEATKSLGVLAVSSGMAALSNLFITIAAKGDTIISANKLFGNTYSLFSKTLPDIGIEFRFADMNNPDSVESLINDKTAGIFFETISNPQMEVADALALSKIAKKHNLPLICDTTKACQNTIEIARWLEKHPAVTRVDYPGLESSLFFELSQKQFKGKSGAVLTFDLDSKESCFKFINALRIIRKATNLNDNKSLILHPAYTIFCEYDNQMLDFMGVRQTAIRLAPGIEEAEDIISDIETGLKAVLE
jgi:O-acetylhomoserine/O-acetylserine sulfhydrylase-like pyridoxal-dependent enzyme